MKIVKSVANVVTFLLDPGKLWTRIDVTAGENFRTLKGERFMLNQTPLVDASLVPISNLHVDNKNMIFNAEVQKVATGFEVDLSKNEAAPLIARFIKKYNEEQWHISTSHFNSVQIKTERKYVTIRLEYIMEGDTNIDNKNWLIISFNKSCNYVQIKEPSLPQKRFEKIKAITLDDLKLRVECAGRDVWSEEDNGEGYTCQWNLDLQPEFADLITGLLDIGIQSQCSNFNR